MKLDIILPINCNTLKKLLLYGITTLFIVSIIQLSIVDIPTNDSLLAIVGSVFGFLGTFFGWIIQISVWYDEGKINIRCKCDK